MLAVLALAAGWPLARTIFFAFTDAQLAGMADARFVGLDNFWNSEWGGLLADPAWWRAVRNTLIFTVVSVGAETVLGTAIALVLDRAFRGRGIVRAVVLIPWAIPTVVSAKIWGWMLHDQFGVVNDLLLRAGLIAAPVAWLASPETAMAAVILVDVWKTTPFVALLALAALQVVPRDIYEAARIDGAGPATVFLRITLPLIWPALAVAVIFRSLDALRIFDVVYVLTGNAEAAMTMSVFARQELVDFQDVGYGSAASTLLFLTIALLVVLFLTIGRVRLTEPTF
jgi:trehalose/maltose transport system permease protein